MHLQGCFQLFQLLQVGQALHLHKLHNVVNVSGFKQLLFFDHGVVAFNEGL